MTGALYIFPVFIAIFLADLLLSSTLLIKYAVYILLIAGFGSAVLIYLCCIATRDLSSDIPEHNVATCVTRKFVLFSEPSTLWYMKTPGQMIFVGFGTFLPICPLMDSIFASLLGLKVCGSLITLLGAFVMVILTTIITGVTLTSVQLVKNDYNWWWR